MSRSCIGIDIGGTKMAIGLVSDAGVVLKRAVLPTEAERGFGRAVDRLVESIRRLIDSNSNEAIGGIGIGCAGPVDSASGRINNPFTLAGWDQCDIVTPLRASFGVDVHLENDADTAALGESAFGAGRGHDPVVMLTFGTGVGGAAVVGGAVYRGVDGEHPEFGHIFVRPDGPDCYCGIKGCLESISSGAAIGAAGRAAGFTDASAVFAASAFGDPAGRAIVSTALDAAASAVWTIYHTFLPQRIILGGGMMDHLFDLFAESVRQKLVNATQFSKNKVSIAAASLGNNAGIVGAASIALQRSSWRQLGAEKAKFANQVQGANS